MTLASRGANTLVCADINLEAAQCTAEISQSRKPAHSTSYKVHALQVDVRDEKSVQQMLDETKALFGRIDYFVNTAGVSLNPAMDACTKRSNCFQPNPGLHFDHRCFVVWAANGLKS